MASNEAATQWPSWGPEPLEFRLKHIIAVAAEWRPSYSLTIAQKKEFLRDLYDKMMVLKDRLLPDHERKAFCGPLGKFVPIELIDSFISEAIRDFDPTIKNRTINNSQPTPRIESRANKLFSPEFNRSPERDLLISWMMECFNRAAEKAWEHADVKKNRIARYLEYGAALRESNAWRQECLDNLEEKLPQELRDLVAEAMVVKSLPPILYYREDATNQVFPKAGPNSGDLEIPSSFRRTDTLDTVTRFLLQGLGEITLVSDRTASPPLTSATYSDSDSEYEEQIDYYGETKSVTKIGMQNTASDPGFAVDITKATTLLAPSIQKAILARISLAHRPIFQRTGPGRCSVNLLPSLAPKAANIKHLDLTITLPIFSASKGFYPSQIYLTQDGLPTLKNALTHLSSLRLTILESDEERGSWVRTRGQYVARGFNKGNTTLKAEVETLIANFRKLDVKYRFMVYVNEDGKDWSEQPPWKEGFSGMNVGSMDGTALGNDEMAKRVMETENVEHLV